MTEAELAASASEQMISSGIWPVVILVGGEERLPRYRHPMPRDGAALGGRAMLVLCARRYGLIANLTRFVYFREPTAEERRLTDAVGRVEAAAFDATRTGSTLGAAYGAIAAAYAAEGFAGADRDHHQGGTCGYRTREEVATVTSTTEIYDRSAFAWNPSLPGAKIEDTVVVSGDGLEILTSDPGWPVVQYGGRPRPDILLAG